MNSEANPAAFVTTHWSVVLSAGQSHTPKSQAALEQLCQAYWFPLYAYARRRGYGPEDAQDMTQEFFARLLEHNWLARADHAKGRFRTFILTAMERFLANEWDKARALKRGGALKILPLTFDSAESRYYAETADALTPADLYERRWAVTLLDTVLERLKQDYERGGKSDLFATLKPCLVGDREGLPYQELARQLGLSENNLKVTVHRLRQRYRELLREEIANTVTSESEIDAEMHHLFNVLARR